MIILHIHSHKSYSLITLCPFPSSKEWFVECVINYTTVYTCTCTCTCCLGSSISRASRLEHVRHGFESHLRCSSFFWEKICLMVCVVLCCFVFLSECLGYSLIPDIVYTMYMYMYMYMCTHHYCRRHSMAKAMSGNIEPASEKKNCLWIWPRTCGKFCPVAGHS